MIRQLSMGIGENQPKDPIYIGPANKICSRVSRMLVMKSEQILAERKSWSNLTISVISGSCMVLTGNGAEKLTEGDIYQIPANCPHELRSLTHFRAVVSFDAYPGCEESQS